MIPMWLAAVGPEPSEKPPSRPRPATSARDLGRADVAAFIGLTGSLRYGRARRHLGSHWQDSDHEGYGNRRVRPTNSARLSHLSRRRDAVLLRGAAHPGVVESLSAAAIRHWRLPRPLLRGLPRAEPLDGVRAVSPPRRRPAFLARARPANRLRHLGRVAGVAGGGICRGALAQNLDGRRPLARHRPARPVQHPADRHLRRAERAFAPSPDLSSFGFGTHRTNWALFAHRLRRGHA